MDQLDSEIVLEPKPRDRTQGVRGQAVAHARVRHQAGDRTQQAQEVARHARRGRRHQQLAVSRRAAANPQPLAQPLDLGRPEQAGVRRRHGRSRAQLDDTTLHQRLQRAQYLVVRVGRVIHQLADLAVELEEQQDFLRQRMDHARQLSAADAQRDVRVERGQLGPEPAQVVELAHAFHQQRACRRRDARRNRHRLGSEGEAPVAPREQAEQRLLPVDRTGGSLDDVALVQVDPAALAPPIRGAAPQLEAAAPPVQVEELEQVCEGNLGEAPFHLFPGLLQHRVELGAPLHQVGDSLSDLVRIGLERQENGAPLGRRRVLGVAQEDESDPARPRVRAQDLDELPGIDQRQRADGDEHLRTLGDARFEGICSVPDGARGETAHGTGFADPVGAIRIGVGDDDEAAHGSSG